MIVLNPGAPVDPIYRRLGAAICTFEGTWLSTSDGSDERAEPGDGHLIYDRAAGTSVRLRAHWPPHAEPDLLLLSGAAALAASRGLTVTPAGAGRGWHRGQEYEERFMNASRRIGAPQRRHGSPSRP